MQKAQKSSLKQNQTARRRWGTTNIRALPLATQQLPSVIHCCSPPGRRPYEMSRKRMELTMSSMVSVGGRYSDGMN
jgi:hypothetical protein